MSDLTAARNYLQNLFQPNDRLCVLLLKGKGKDRQVEQHFMAAEDLWNPERLTGLQEQNNEGTNVYCTVNALKPGAQSRTKDDVAAVQCVYLDIDDDGPDVLERVLADVAKGVIPHPTYIHNTSLGKFQPIWKVRDFEREDAEALIRGMAAKYGADRAVHDIARVLRIPGFANRKYEEPFPVTTAEKDFNRVFSPADFGVERLYEHSPSDAKQNPVRTPEKSGGDGYSQSERDWFEVCRRLERGDNPADVRNWLEQFRQDKPRPGYYAERTVRRAVDYVNQKMESGGKNTSDKANLEGAWLPQIENNNQTQQENSVMEKYYIAGNTLEIKDQLKEMGCRWDKEKGQWYHTDPAIAGKAQSLVPEKHYIGSAPKELSETLKAMGAKWDEKGWYHADPEKAGDAYRKILEAEPRYYLTGATEAVKDKLKELGFRWDPCVKQWYHTDAEKAKTIQVMVPEKHYIGSAPKELSETLKAMGARWDEKGWYHTSPAVAESARKQILAVEPRYYLTGATEAVKDKLKGLGCRWDPRASQWYHTDPEKAKEAQALVPEKQYIGFAPKELSETLKELGCRWDEKGWYHTDKDVAEKAQQKVLEAVPRHYIDGDAMPVKKQLKEIGCHWDPRASQWYHTDAEKAKEAQAFVSNGLEKHYIPDVFYKLNQKMHEMGGRWDNEKKCWYFTDPGKAREAEQLANETREKSHRTESTPAVVNNIVHKM